MKKELPETAARFKDIDVMCIILRVADTQRFAACNKAGLKTSKTSLRSSASARSHSSISAAQAPVSAFLFHVRGGSSRCVIEWLEPDEGYCTCTKIYLATKPSSCRLQTVCTRQHIGRRVLLETVAFMPPVTLMVR